MELCFFPLLSSRRRKNRRLANLALQVKIHGIRVTEPGETLEITEPAAFTLGLIGSVEAALGSEEERELGLEVDLSTDPVLTTGECGHQCLAVSTILSMIG